MPVLQGFPSFVYEISHTPCLLCHLVAHSVGGSEQEAANDASLFLSETYQPLTRNALTLLFSRLRKRAGVTETAVNPLLLRDTCAVRYLRAGEESESLCALLGLKSKAALDRYERLVQSQEGPSHKNQEHVSGSMGVSRKRRRHRGRPSAVAPKRDG